MPSQCRPRTQPATKLAAGPLAGALLLVGTTACAGADSTLEAESNDSLTTTTVAQGLENPWSIAFLSDQEWLITERGGDLLRVVDGELQEQPVSGVPEVVARNQGGLFHVLPHPDFDDNRRLYLSYAKACDEGSTTAVGHGTYRDGELRDFQDIFVAESACTDTHKHFGGRFLFDKDGHLFLTVGDRGERDRAQDTGDHGGSVLRLTEDGGVPDGNPLTDEDGARPEIWSWGHRNAQGLALHPDTGDLWLNEHGPRGGDEINRVQPEVNYGWPVITYGREYHGPGIGEEKKDGYQQPLLHWTPSIAPSGMVFVTGERYPDWQGDTLHGALKLTHLNRVAFDGTTPTDETRYLEEAGDRIRDVAQGPDGYIYLLTDAPAGKLLRVEPPAS